MKVLRQIVRGCGTLPHMGPHPGRGYLLLFIAMGAAAGIDNGGLRGAVGGALIMGLVMGVLFLMGAYGRAEDSDRIQARRERQA